MLSLRLLLGLALGFSLLGSGCATVPYEKTPGETQLRLPGLPWGASTPEVTAALVERGFRFAGRNEAGDLRFDDGELLGHDASLLARMHQDHLVKVVTYLESGAPEMMQEEIDTILETLQRFYGPPTFKNDCSEPARSSSPPPSTGTTDCRLKLLAWLKNRPDGRAFGVMVRPTPRPAYRIDFESPAWPDIYDIRGREGTLQDLSSSLET